MGNHAGKREPGAEKGGKDGGAHRGEPEKRMDRRGPPRDASEDNDVFGT